MASTRLAPAFLARKRERAEFLYPCAGIRASARMCEHEEGEVGERGKHDPQFRAGRSAGQSIAQSLRRRLYSEPGAILRQKLRLQ